MSVLEFLLIVYFLFGFGISLSVWRINKDSSILEVFGFFILMPMWPVFLGFAIIEKLDN